MVLLGVARSVRFLPRFVDLLIFGKVSPIRTTLGALSFWMSEPVVGVEFRRLGDCNNVILWPMCAEVVASGSALRSEQCFAAKGSKNVCR